MALISVRSTRSFRQFRAAVFGISVFLRLAWGFILAMNVFALTTRLDHVHQANTVYLFAVNGLAVLVAAIVGGAETGRIGLAFRTSQVGFELCWISAFFVLELVGAVMFTILRPFFQCENIAQAGAQPGTWTTRKSTPNEVAMCDLSNQLAFFGLWIIVGLSLLYFFYFLSLCIAAARRDRSVWHTPVFRFEWAITSQRKVIEQPDDFNPAMLQRPGNPHLSKLKEDSASTLPPVFSNPFVPSEPAFEIVRPAPVLNRHQIMSHYHSDSVSTRSYSSSRSITPPQPSKFRFSALGLDVDSMTTKVPSKHKPNLSIQIPPPEPSTLTPVHAEDLHPHEEIGFAVMEMPFTATISSPSQASSESHASGDKNAASSTKAAVSHSHDGLLSVQSYKQSKAMQRGVERGSYNPPVQSIPAPREYPTVEQTEYRQSTLIAQNQGQLPPPITKYIPRQLTFPAPLANRNSNMLPLHQGDVRYSQHYAPYNFPAPAQQQQPAQNFIPQGNLGNGVYYQPPPHAPIRQSQTWPLDARSFPQTYTHQKRPSAPTDMNSMNRGFPFRVPPPPDHSPSVAPQTVMSTGGTYTPGATMHTRSASTPLFYYNSPTAATGPRPSYESRAFSPAETTLTSRRGSMFPQAGVPWSDSSAPPSQYVSPVGSPLEEPEKEKRRSRKLRKSIHNMHR